MKSSLCDITVSPGEQAPPIAIAGRDVIVQPGETVTLNGIESLALGNADITDYHWELQGGDGGVKMEVRHVHAHLSVQVSVHVSVHGGPTCLCFDRVTASSIFKGCSVPEVCFI